MSHNESDPIHKCKFTVFLNQPARRTEQGSPPLARPADW